MMVCCLNANGFLVENLNSCASGMPVMMANSPRAVEKCGVKHRSKKIPCLVNESKKGVASRALPLMLLLYILNDSHITSTTLGLLSRALLPGCTTRLKENVFLSGSGIQSAITGNEALAFCSLNSGLRNFNVEKKF